MHFLALFVNNILDFLDILNNILHKVFGSFNLAVDEAFIILWPCCFRCESLASISAPKLFAGVRSKRCKETNPVVKDSG